MKRDELLEKLDQWIRRVRRDEAPDNIIWHIDDESAYQDIVALIKKPMLTKEFIEKKAIKLHKEVYGSLMKCDFKCHMMIKFREQIRMIFEEE